MTYKPRLEPPYPPQLPLKEKHIGHSIYISYVTPSLKDALKQLSDKSNLIFDESDYDNIFIHPAGEESVEFSYNKTINNENYDKDMENYKKRYKQYERDLTRYNEMVKMIDNFKQEKKK
jgi:hypothetical protein